MRVLSTIALLAGSEYAISFHNVEQLPGGLIYGLIQKDELTEIEKCLQDGAGVEKDINDAIHDFMKGDIADIIDGVKLIAQALVTLPEDMVDCQYTDDDLRRLAEWAQIFTAPKHLSAVVAKNMVLHGKKIHEAVNAIPDDMRKGDEYQARRAKAGDRDGTGRGESEVDRGE